MAGRGRRPLARFEAFTQGASLPLYYVGSPPPSTPTGMSVSIGEPGGPMGTGMGLSTPTTAYHAEIVSDSETFRRG